MMGRHSLTAKFSGEAEMVLRLCDVNFPSELSGEIFALNLAGNFLLHFPPNLAGKLDPVNLAGKLAFQIFANFPAKFSGKMFGKFPSKFSGET